MRLRCGNIGCFKKGVIGVEKDFLRMNDGGQPPVMHVDSTAPLYSDSNKKINYRGTLGNLL